VISYFGLNVSDNGAFRQRQSCEFLEREYRQSRTRHNLFYERPARLPFPVTLLKIAEDCEQA
jgi:hypothetical protein